METLRNRGSVGSRWKAWIVAGALVAIAVSGWGCESRQKPAAGGGSQPQQKSAAGKSDGAVLAPQETRTFRKEVRYELKSPPEPMKDARDTATFKALNAVMAEDVLKVMRGLKKFQNYKIDESLVACDTCRFGTTLVYEMVDTKLVEEKQVKEDGKDVVRFVFNVTVPLYAVEDSVVEALVLPIIGETQALEKQVKTKPDHERLVKLYSQRIELVPEYKGAYVNRGNSYAKLGQRAQAYQDWRKACELKVEDVCDFLRKNPE